MKKEIKRERKTESSALSEKKGWTIPLKYQTPLLLLVIFVVFLVYYSPMYFGGETFQSGDIVTSMSTRTYIDNEHEEFTLWYPYIFGGMPGYALSVGYKWFNLIYVAKAAVVSSFQSLFSVDYTMWTLYLIILAFTTFYLVEYLTRNKLIALFASLSVSFSTRLVTLLAAGHVTKLTVLCILPLLILFLLKFEKEIKLKDFAILVIALQISLQGWHVQVIFYTLFAIGIYFLFNLVYSIIKKEQARIKQFFKSGLTFAAAFTIALLIQSDNLTQIYEYNKFSTRGTKGILEETTATGEKSSDSEFYQYATNWSFSPGEVLTFIIPSYYGFGKSTYQGQLTQNKPVPVNTYFGQMPFVDVPLYMGVVVFFLALFGLYSHRKNRFIQYLALLITISLLISFGRTFPLVYDLMFYYFPFFDKFRIPSMILLLVQVTLPVLAAFGIKGIIDLVKENDTHLLKVVQYFAIILTSLFVISLVFGSGLTEWFSGRVNSFASENLRAAQMFRALSDYMSDMFIGDVRFAFGISSVVFLLALALIKRKVSISVFLIAVVVLSFADLYRVNKRSEEYVQDQNIEELFAQPDYLKTIQDQNDPQPFRMLNLKQDGSMGSFRNNSNFNSYFLLHDLYGYSAIKPRSFQDYMDVVGPFNETLWRMLNVKYLIFEQANPMPSLRLLENSEKTFVYEFTDVLPRAYFVDSVATAVPLEILNLVKNNGFDPKQVSYLTDLTLDIDKPGNNASVTVTKYLDEKIELDVLATGNNLLFLGDTYYPNGWRAYVDGNETPIYKLNHGFRGVIVPEGKHKIVFEYRPTSFVVSKYLALSLSFLTILGLSLGLYFDSKKNK